MVDLEVSQQSVAKLMESDRLILEKLGIELAGLSSSQITLEMTVDEGMVNSQKFCHGGLIFSLADTACAYICAAYNVAPATTEANISYIAPAKEGDVLRAIAQIENSQGKMYYCSVRVLNQLEEVLALYKASLISRGRVC